MNITEFQMNKEVIARGSDGSEIKGVLKGTIQDQVLQVILGVINKEESLCILTE